MCTHEGALPQGAPTSPIISNFVCRNLDRELWRLAVRHSCVYSRYADDITFSTNQHHLPNGMVELSTPASKEARLGPEVNTILERNGFSANPSKTRVQLSTERQIVTGIIVNSRVNLPRSYSREIRAIYHSKRPIRTSRRKKDFMTLCSAERRPRGCRRCTLTCKDG